MPRSLLFVAAAVLLCPASLYAEAAAPQHLQGTVVSASAGTLVMKNEKGAEQTFRVDASAKIMVNGKPGRLEDFQPTMAVQVTTDEKDKVLAVSTVDRLKRRAARTLVVVEGAGVEGGPDRMLVLNR